MTLYWICFMCWIATQNLESEGGLGGGPFKRAGGEGGEAKKKKAGSISQLENIEHHTLCPWICLIVLITIIRINMFVAYWTYIPLFSKVTLANGARSNSYVSMFTSKEILTFLRVPFQIYCAWEVCWRILVYSVVFALWLPWYTFLFIVYQLQ